MDMTCALCGEKLDKWDCLVGEKYHYCHNCGEEACDREYELHKKIQARHEAPLVETLKHIALWGGEQGWGGLQCAETARTALQKAGYEIVIKGH